MIRKKCYTAVIKMDNQQGPTVQPKGIPLNDMWQPGWERTLGENGYMCVYG